MQLLSSAFVLRDALVAGTAKALAAPAQAAPGEGAVEAEAARAQEGGEVLTGPEGREALGERVPCTSIWPYLRGLAMAPGLRMAVVGP